MITTFWVRLWSVGEGREGSPRSTVQRLYEGVLERDCDFSPVIEPAF